MDLMSRGILKMFSCCIVRVMITNRLISHNFILWRVDLSSHPAWDWLYQFLFYLFIKIIKESCMKRLKVNNAESILLIFKYKSIKWIKNDSLSVKLILSIF